MFDPLSNYFDPHLVPLTNPNSLLNLDMVWSKTQRSNPNPANLGSLMTPSSSSSTQNHPFFTNQLGGQSREGAFPNLHIPSGWKMLRGLVPIRQTITPPIQMFYIYWRRLRKHWVSFYSLDLIWVLRSRSVCFTRSR
jgi:hypothetical protein